VARRVAAAAFEQVGEGDEVGLHRRRRPLERGAHARLRREVQHQFGLRGGN